MLILSKLKAFAQRQDKHDKKIEICFCEGGKHCGKRRKCCLEAFSPFPALFSKGIFLRTV